MLDFTDREELGRDLFEKISFVEPDEWQALQLAEWTLDMEDEAITAIFGDEDSDALEAQVQRLKLWYQRGWTTLDDADEEGDPDYEWIATPTSSKASWQIPTAESIDQSDAMATEPEIQGEDQGMMNPPPSRASLETPQWLADTHYTLSDFEAEEFVETTRDPAKLDTMKEVYEVSPAPPRAQETVQGDGVCNPLASTSTTSYVLGATRNPVPSAAGAAAPQRNTVESERETIRAPEGDRAADNRHVYIEMEPYTCWPLIPMVYLPQPAQRAQRPTEGAAQPDDADVQRQKLHERWMKWMCGIGIACDLALTLVFVLAII